MNNENYCYVVSSYSFAFNDDYNYIISYEGGEPQAIYNSLEAAQEACKKANYKRWKELIEGEIDDMYNDIPLNNPFIKEDDIRNVKEIFESEGVEFSSKMSDEQIERMIQLFTEIVEQRYVEKVAMAIKNTVLDVYTTYMNELISKINLPYEQHGDLREILKKENKWRRLPESEILQKKLEEKVLALVKLNEFYHVEKAVFVDE